MDGNIDNFIEEPQTAVHNIMALWCKYKIIMGNVNINWNMHQESNTKQLSAFYQNNLNEIDNEATRVTESTNTTIDHIATNRSEMYYQHSEI